MRIQFVCSEFDVLAEPGAPGWSGRGALIRGLAGALAEEGHDAAVLCGRAGGTGPEEHEPRPGLTVRYVCDAGATHPHGRGLRERLAGIWLQAPPDVVHACGGASGVAAADAAAATGSALVQSFSAVTGATGAGDHAAQDVLLRRAERIVATSEAQHDDLVRRGAPRGRLRVVPPGVDADVWRPDGASLRRGDPARVVLAGSLEPDGGADDVVAALRHAPDTELYVAGGPAPGGAGDTDLLRLQDVAARSGTGRRVRFLGAVGRDDVARLLRSADVVACPSRRDAGGASALEAMACGRPVVATAVGCQGDIVVDGVTGVLVRPARPDELGAALRTMLADRAGREASGIAGRDRVLARYGWTRIAQAMTAVYEEAAAVLRPAPVVEPEPEPVAAG